jgi:hypothetical protein
MGVRWILLGFGMRKLCDRGPRGAPVEYLDVNERRVLESLPESDSGLRIVVARPLPIERARKRPFLYLPRIQWIDPV